MNPNQNFHLISMTGRVDTSPESVGFIMGRGKKNLRQFCCSIKSSTGRSLFIEYVNHHHSYCGYWMIHAKCYDDLNYASWWILNREKIFLRGVSSGVLTADLNNCNDNVQLTVAKPKHVRFDDSGDIVLESDQSETQQLQDMIDRIHC